MSQSYHWLLQPQTGSQNHWPPQFLLLHSHPTKRVLGGYYPEPDDLHPLLTPVLLPVHRGPKSGQQGLRALPWALPQPQVVLSFFRQHNIDWYSRTIIFPLMRSQGKNTIRSSKNGLWGQLWVSFPLPQPSSSAKFFLSCPHHKAKLPFSQEFRIISSLKWTWRSPSPFTELGLECLFSAASLSSSWRPGRGPGTGDAGWQRPRPCLERADV